MMTLLEAFGLLGVREDRSIFPCPCHFSAGDGTPIDVWPAVATALAGLSGQLEDATCEADLDEAVKHGASLLEAGVIDCDAVEAETKRVIAEVHKWGQWAETCLN